MTDFVTFDEYCQRENDGFDLIYADPPWPYPDGQTEKASAHYDLMTWDEINSMPVNDVCKERAALCLWATGPFLDRQIDTMNRWGFHYRGVAQVWVKTRKDGQVIGAQGGVPTFVKSKCEFLLYGTTCKSGRPFTVHDFTVRQAVLAPVERHSKKPDVFRANLDRLCGPDTRKLELFARSRWDAPGWFQSGLEFNGVDYRDGDLIGPQG